MNLDQLIERLTAKRAAISAFHKIDAGQLDVVLWGSDDEDDLPTVTGVDYDKFESDTPWVVIIQKAGDPVIGVPRRC